MFNVLDIFSGIGGFSLGLERAGGFKTVGFCEVDAYCQQVLRKHWPKVPIYEDVRELNADTLSRDGITVDVIAGGFPCQDLSYAGNGAGLNGLRSGLWHEYCRLIRELRPDYVIVENVSALLGRGLGTVLGNLATLGYDAEWQCIRATAVGLPHSRDRVWIVAYPNGLRKLQPLWSFCDFGGWVLHPFQGAVWPLPDCARDGNAYGISAAMDALGNAVVPGIPERIGCAIKSFAKSESAGKP